MLERSGAYERAAALFEDGLVRWREVGNTLGVAWVLTKLGWCLLALGEVERATALMEESMAMARETGFFVGISHALGHLGWAAYLQGDYA